MEASRVTVGDKTYDLNILKGKRKTILRRKAIIDYIQSKPAGAIIPVKQFQRAIHFSTVPNAHAFIQRMIRDGIISRQDGERLGTYSYTVMGAVADKKPTAKKQSPQPKSEHISEAEQESLMSILTDIRGRGLHFTITISSEEIK